MTELSTAHLHREIPSGNQQKGRAPEGCGQKENHMLKVTERTDVPQVSMPVYSTVSESKKLGIWLDSLVEKSKTKPVSQIISLTPALAEILLNRNPANRKLNESAVERFAYEMDGGRWTFNGEPILIADTGELNDGQHRCAAVMKSGAAIDVIIIVGVPRASRTTLDQGRARTAADYLSMEGHANSTNLAVAANFAWQYRMRGVLAKGGAAKATKSEIIQFVEENPGIRRSVELFNNKVARGLGGISLLAFCHFAISAVAKRADVDEFFTAMTEGANLGVGHPALYVRTRMIAMMGHHDKNARAELIFKAWNAWRRGEEVTRIWLSGALPTLEK